MQTFLPYASFDQSARSLSDGVGGHLNNQRNEGLVILKSCLSAYGGWPNHSATRMWRGYEHYLVLYIEAIHKECLRRKIAGESAYEAAMQLQHLFKLQVKAPERPPWLGSMRFHRSHRSNLIRKQPEHYRPIFGPHVRDDLPYIWPKGKT